MKEVIPYGKHHISDEDIKAVTDVLRSDFLTQGPKIKSFEKAFAQYTGAGYAVAVSNGTTALHLANIALGIEKGDKIITTPITFAATANSALYVGADVEFVDINPKTYTIDLDKLEKKLKENKSGTYKAVLPVDFAGYPVNMQKLRFLAEEFDFSIIEDACHAPGGFFIDTKGDKEFCGGGKYSDLAVFSLHPVKHIAAGEGGVITTNDDYLYEKLLLLRTHGITKSPELLEENHGEWYYEMHELGYNYRLTDIQAALAYTQLQKADEGLLKRKEIAIRYNSAFSKSSLITPYSSTDISHAYHLYVIQTERRKSMYDFLRKNNIYSQVHYIPVHLQPYYKKKYGYKKGDFPIAEAYYEKCLSLPMYPSLTIEEQNYVIEKVLEFLG